MASKACVKQEVDELYEDDPQIKVEWEETDVQELVLIKWEPKWTGDLPSLTTNVKEGSGLPELYAGRKVLVLDRETQPAGDSGASVQPMCGSSAVPPKRAPITGPSPAPQSAKDPLTKAYRSLIKHINTDYKPFSCDMCMKRFTKKITLIRHRRVHTGEKPDTSNNLKQKRMDTKVRPYSCELCHKQFTTKNSLIQHYGKVTKKSRRKQQTRGRR